MPALVLVVAVSLAANVMLAQRVRDSQDEAARLRSRVAALEGDVDALRGRVRGSGRGDPLARIASAVERLRGLEFTEPVEPELLPPREFRRRVRSLFLEQNTRAEIEASGRVLEALGMLEPGTDLYAILVPLYEEQVAGYYDDETKTLVVSSTNATSPSPLTQVFLAHEYTHALTDQVFDIGRLDRLREEGDDDAATAYLSLLEGDATLVSQLYAEQVLTDEERGRLVAESARVGVDRFTSLPAFLQSVFLFPYRDGLDFVSAIHRRGGFDLVDAAYRDPPASTEHILHPTRFIDPTDDPVEVAMPVLARTLGSRWRGLDDGGAGELDVRLILDEFLGTGESVRAAEGWDGGRFVATAAGDEVLVAMLTEWDSTGDAREATRAFERWLPLRYGDEGNEVDVRPSDGRGWSAPGGAGLVLRDDRRVLLVVGPDTATVQRARRAFDGF